VGSFEPTGQWTSLQQLPLSGVPYTLYGLRIRGGRLTATIYPGELWHDWCALQKSYPYVGAAYSCAAAYDPSIDTSGPEPPPNPSAFCTGWGSGVRGCECDQSSCHANLTAYPYTLDLQMNDSSYEGEITPPWDNNGGIWLPGVRLVRQ
jgi:hypothetical protein